MNLTKKNHKFRKKRHINIVWPLTQHPQFILHNSVLLCLTLILRFFSAHKEHWLLLFALALNEKSNTHQTTICELFFFFLPWCKKAHKCVYAHKTLSQILHISGGTIKKKKKKKGRRWFCGTAVITEESKHGAGADLCGLSLVKQRRANGLKGLDSKVSVVEVRQVEWWLRCVCVYEQTL